MSVRSVFISGLRPYPVAEPEGAFQRLLQLGARYITAEAWNPLNTTQKWPWPPWRPWVLSHLGGKMAAKAVMLYVQVHGTCGQQGPVTQTPQVSTELPASLWTNHLTLLYLSAFSTQFLWFLYGFEIFLSCFDLYLLLYLCVYFLFFNEYICQTIRLLWQERESNLPSQRYLFLASAHLVILASSPPLCLFCYCLNCCLFTVGPWFPPMVYL